MKRQLFALPCACLLIALFAGCATPTSRIEKNLDLFNSFPLEAQSLIREGRIDLGFTPDMVQMALGDPARSYHRRTESRESEVWSYVDHRYTTERQRVNANVPTYDSTGRRHSSRQWIWVDVQKSEEYEKLRIEFLDGKVSAIETVER
jgi:hypothetical protein